jgi:hypothetical protein
MAESIWPITIRGTKMDDFYHDDKAIEGFRDFRDDVSRPPSLREMYYIVLRLKIGNSVWYHHAAMAIDDGLHSHIEATKCILRASLNRPNAEINCVFVRCFIMRDLSVMTPADHQRTINEMNARIADCAIFCDEVKKVLVLGFVGTDQVILLDIADNDAMSANGMGIQKCAEEYQKVLHPIDIVAASPAIPGIVALFEKRAPQLLALVNSPCNIGKRSRVHGEQHGAL